MKKTISIPIVILSSIMLLALPMISATMYFGNIVVDTLNLQQKNPNNWSVVTNGAKGIVEFNTINTPWAVIQQRMSVKVYKLQPSTKYQLIYYGDKTHNDVWAYATCIGVPRMTSTQGFFSSGSYEFNHLAMRNDGINQKFWVVLASDVDCLKGRMTAWNPTKYLFEEHTI